MFLLSIMECGSVTKYGKYQWPTDGVTRKQLDKELDKLTRRIDHWKAKHKALEDRLEHLEETVFGKLPKYRHQ